MIIGSLIFFFQQKTSYERRISDWSSDVCSSDLLLDHREEQGVLAGLALADPLVETHPVGAERADRQIGPHPRSVEPTSELQSLMRISYAVICLKKNTNTPIKHNI